MKILWLSNCDLTAPKVSSTGTWLYAMSNSLVGKGVEIINVTTGKVKTTVVKRDKGIIQYILPATRVHKGLPSKRIISELQQIQVKTAPDLIHVWGTEKYWGLLCVRGYLKTPFVLDIQGLLYTVHRRYMSNLSYCELFRCIRFKEILYPQCSILLSKHSLLQRVKIEKEILKHSKYISTQSEWVRAHIAPLLCDDAIVISTKMAVRPAFLEDNFRWRNKGRHEIVFVSSTATPYKGLHDAIRALYLVKYQYQDAKLSIIGNIGNKSPFWRKSGYLKYITSLIKELNLSSSVIFRGPLSEEDMCDVMKEAGVMVIPTYVESYCLAMAEAMAIGLPCVASYSGALPELATNEESALYYDAGDLEMMAHQICRMFKDNVLAQTISNNSRITAAKRNNEETVCERQFEIYKEVLKYVDSNNN